MKLTITSDPSASLRYRATNHLRLPPIVVASTIVEATLAVLVTSPLLALAVGGRA